MGILVLPVGEELDGQTIRIDLPETEVSLQRERVPDGQSGAEERWALIGVKSEFTAQTYAAIERNGRAVTGQWRLDGAEFTLLICFGKDGLAVDLLTKDDWFRWYSAQLNIPSMPSNSEEHVVSTHTPLSAYEVFPLGQFQRSFSKVKFE